MTSTEFKPPLEWVPHVSGTPNHQGVMFGGLKLTNAETAELITRLQLRVAENEKAMREAHYGS